MAGLEDGDARILDECLNWSGSGFPSSQPVRIPTDYPVAVWLSGLPKLNSTRLRISVVGQNVSSPSCFDPTTAPSP